ncbi:MAG TPA: AtzH-like domain-containing protein [Ilumatobacteraceae bacterium]
MPNANEIEVRAMSDAYEAALLANDIDAMNGVFWESPEVLRFGVGDAQVGIDEVVAWRAAAIPVSPRRRITSRTILELAPGVVAVDLTFRNGDEHAIGRQSQTWVRGDDGWRIARAHVSVIPA